MSLAAREAVATALDEAKANPIAIGEHVGHSEFATYGTASGKLIAYEGDKSVVETSSGEQIRWKTEGMVDIKRVYILAEKYTQRLETIGRLVEVMELLGIPPQDTIEQLMAGAPDGPTPGCDCPHCSQFTPEEHEAERVKLAVAEAQAAEGGETTQAAAASASDPNTNGTGKFPFDDFLNSTRR